METGGGRHWAAIRIPNDALWIQATAYRIGQIDPNNRDVMVSPDLLEFATRHDLYNPEREMFDFAEAFGGRATKYSEYQPVSNMRIWRAINLLNPKLQVHPNQLEYPQWIRPEDKISLQNLITVLRDQYQDIHPDSLAHDSLNLARANIASQKTTYSTVIQLTNGLPASVGAVLWTGLGSSVTTPYIPFYFGINEIPKPFDKDTPDKQKAYRFFRRLSDLYYNNPGKYADLFPAVWDDFQNRAVREQVEIDQGAMRLNRMDSRMSRHFLTVNVEALGQQAIDIATRKLEEADEY